MGLDHFDGRIACSISFSAANLELGFSFSGRYVPALFFLGSWFYSKCFL